jgi:hypothetical protein
MSLVKVWTDVGGRKPAALLAKIIDKDGVIFTIRYLTSGKDGIWRYEDDTYEIDDDSVAEYLKSDDETAIGFLATDDGGFIREEDSDKDYEPSGSEDDDDDEEDDDDDDDDVENNEEEFDENEDEEEFEEDEE